MNKYDLFKEKMAEIADLRNAVAVLNWDQETYMPLKGTGMRARQIATLSSLSHEKFTTQELFDLTAELLDSADLSEIQMINVKKTKQDLDKLRKFDSSFIKQQSLAISKSFVDWNKAKDEDNFKLFESSLAELIALKKEEADISGYQDHPYDALLDTYEPQMTCAKLDIIFGGLKPELSQLLNKIAQAPQIDDAFLFDQYDIDRQWQFGLTVLKNLGYDFDAGRQDKSSHPFTTSFSSEDVRITTRVNEHDFAEMLWSSIHEGGHAIYEQGLPADQYGLPAGQYLSLSIHESQSRLYENNLGRSKAFWEYHFPILQNNFSQFKSLDINSFYKAINTVKPSLIRTNADELSYHFHVIIRYEIERAIMSGEVDAKDLPELWNSKYDAYLGIKPNSDKVGVLQDIHWSHGSFGYFPTYSLGSLYAAQFMAQYKSDHENAEEQFRSGDYALIKKWLNQHIHSKGKTLSSEELCEELTGSGLNHSAFMLYANSKYGEIYNI